MYIVNAINTSKLIAFKYHFLISNTGSSRWHLYSICCKPVYALYGKTNLVFTCIDRKNNINQPPPTPCTGQWILIYSDTYLSCGNTRTENFCIAHVSLLLLQPLRSDKADLCKAVRFIEIQLWDVLQRLASQDGQAFLLLTRINDYINTKWLEIFAYPGDNLNPTEVKQNVSNTKRPLYFAYVFSSVDEMNYKSIWFLMALRLDPFIP